MTAITPYNIVVYLHFHNADHIPLCVCSTEAKAKFISSMLRAKYIVWEPTW